MKHCVLSLAFFVLGLQTVFARTEVEIPINVGMGPSLFWLPGIVDDRDWHTGVRLDLYAVLDQPTIKKFKNRIPKKFRGMATAQREIHISPMIMYLVPDAIIISPGDSSSIYGATWTLFGIGLNLVDTPFLEASANLDLPSLTYLWASSTANNPDNTHLFGIGASPSLNSLVHLSDNWLLGLSYYHTVQLPLTMGAYQRDSGPEKQWTHFGEISAMLHYRFPMRQTI